MPGASWTQPNFETQDSTSYKTSIDNCIQLAERMCRGFAPREEDSPIMKVRVDTGYVFYASTGTLTSISSALSPLFVTPQTDNRVDRLVTSTSGTLTIIKGVCATTPSVPAITAGLYPICRVSLTTGTIAIVDSLITDERVSGVLTLDASTGANSHGIRTYLAASAFTAPAGVSMVWVSGSAGGGGGGGCSTTYPACGGGGAGEYQLPTATSVTPTYVYTITIGAGGSGGTAGSNGSVGHATSMVKGTRNAAYLAGGNYGGAGGGQTLSVGLGTIYIGGDGYGNAYGEGGTGAIGSKTSAVAGRGGAGYGGGGGGAAGYGNAAGAGGRPGFLTIQW